MKRNLSIIVAALTLSLALVLAACASESSTETPTPSPAKPDTSATAPEKNVSDPNAQVIAAGEDLLIPLSDVTESAKFYPIETDGTAMEVLVIKASDGTIRTAFNTCQVCFDSGRGYYKQEGNKLVCQNCGNSFTADMVEVKSGGCNPYPIFDSDKTVSDDSIAISYDFLSAATKVFKNWKSNA
jgi:uncharacterized membrane protein